MVELVNVRFKFWKYFDRVFLNIFIFFVGEDILIVVVLCNKYLLVLSIEKDNDEVIGCKMLYFLRLNNDL